MKSNVTLPEFLGSRHGHLATIRSCRHYKAQAGPERM
jgi:hypothetical protein